MCSDRPTRRCSFFLYLTLHHTLISCKVQKSLGESNPFSPLLEKCSIIKGRLGRVEVCLCLCVCSCWQSPCVTVSPRFFRFDDLDNEDELRECVRLLLLCIRAGWLQRTTHYILFVFAECPRVLVKSRRRSVGLLKRPVSHEMTPRGDTLSQNTPTQDVGRTRTHTDTLCY